MAFIVLRYGATRVRCTFRSTQEWEALCEAVRSRLALRGPISLHDAGGIEVRSAADLVNGEELEVRAGASSVPRPGSAASSDDDDLALQLWARRQVVSREFPRGREPQLPGRRHSPPRLPSGPAQSPPPERRRRGREPGPRQHHSPATAQAAATAASPARSHGETWMREFTSLGFAEEAPNGRSSWDASTSPAHHRPSTMRRPWQMPSSPPLADYDRATDDDDSPPPPRRLLRPATSAAALGRRRPLLASRSAPRLARPEAGTRAWLPGPAVGGFLAPPPADGHRGPRPGFSEALCRSLEDRILELEAERERIPLYPMTAASERGQLGGEIARLRSELGRVVAGAGRRR